MFKIFNEDFKKEQPSYNSVLENDFNENEILNYIW